MKFSAWYGIVVGFGMFAVILVGAVISLMFLTREKIETHQLALERKD